MGHHNKKPNSEKLPPKERLKQKRKQEKKFRTEKKARLIVKNLSFKTTEEEFQQHFEKFGDVVEVKLLKRPDGKLVGCGFVQFKEVQKAAKARFHTDGKDFLGRKISCDWALSKDKYLDKINDIKQEVAEVKQEPVDVDAVKQEPDEENLDTSVKTEQDSDSGDEGVKEEDDDIKNLSESEKEDEGEDEDHDDDKASSEDEKKKIMEKSERPRFMSNDVSEGKTVFVKNIPFSATNEDLKYCMRQFGPVYYALICYDKFTEHSKGTGFVKFVNFEDAQKCLEAGTELKLFDNILDCVKAMNKDDIDKKNDKKEEKKDSRNLYLVKEGVVLAGTKAAEGVSAADMAKRLQIEQYKTQMLRNLNMFVSRNRLVIHNLPASWDDSKLRQLFQKHAGPKAIIREARVMRNMKKLDSNGVGASKEFGFVTFATHEDALAALRSLNNNPNIFSETKRPIVAFSIENKTMIKVKEKRLLNSRKKNPISKEYNPNLHQTKPESNSKSNTEDKPNSKKRGKKRRNQAEKEDGQSEVERKKFEPKESSFSGVEAKQGVNKMRSRYNLKTQAQLHHKNLKETKKKQKFAKKTLQQRKQDFVRQPRQKINKKSENDNFSKLVNSYKKKLMAPVAAAKQKWFEAT